MIFFMNDSLASNARTHHGPPHVNGPYLAASANAWGLGAEASVSPRLNGIDPMGWPDNTIWSGWGETSAFAATGDATGGQSGGNEKRDQVVISIQERNTEFEIALERWTELGASLNHETGAEIFAEAGIDPFFAVGASSSTTMIGAAGSEEIRLNVSVSKKTAYQSPDAVSKYAVCGECCGYFQKTRRPAASGASSKASAAPEQGSFLAADDAQTDAWPRKTAAVPK